MSEYQRNSKQVFILGERLTITERNAIDVIKLGQFSKDRKYDLTLMVFEGATVVVDGLKHSIKTLKWYQVFTWLRYKYKLRARYLVRKLSSSTIMRYSRIVHELEGVKLDEAEKKNLKHAQTLKK